MKKRVLFIARFQPFHKGHLNALKEIVEENKEIIVVIGSSNKNFSFKNPLSIAERLEMLRKVIDKENWEKQAVYLLPFPDNPDNLVWVKKLTNLLPPFSLVVTDNNLVIRLFEAENIKVKKPNLKNREKWQGSVLRGLIKKNDNSWRQHIPRYLLSLLEGFGFSKRLKNL